MTTPSTDTVETEVVAAAGRRIPPLPVDGNEVAVQELLDDIRCNGGGPAMTWFQTFGHAPGLLRRYRPFGAKLLSAGRLSARHREIAILRTASRSNCRYEAAHHRPIAQAEGLHPLQIAAALDPTVSCHTWTPLEQAILNAADQISCDAFIREPTWATLQAHLEPAELVELVMLIGHYRMVAGAMNSLGVPLDEPAPPNVWPGTRPRQLPELTEENAFFWTSGADGLLRFMQCTSCGYYLHPPGPRCPQCGGQVEPSPVTGQGTIVSYTVNHQPWAPIPAPYAIVLVELDDQEGLRLTSNLARDDAVEPRIGERVTVAFEQYGSTYIPVFRRCPEANRGDNS